MSKTPSTSPDAFRSSIETVVRLFNNVYGKGTKKAGESRKGPGSADKKVKPRAKKAP